jgi:hypothetical protein
VCKRLPAPQRGKSKQKENTSLHLHLFSGLELKSLDLMEEVVCVFRDNLFNVILKDRELCIYLSFSVGMLSKADDSQSRDAPEPFLD